MTVTREDLARAAAALRAGELVAFPTETVYGLGADASSPEALQRLYEVKRRPADHPVIVHIADVEAVDTWAVDVPDPARQLAAACWPGPLTLVLRRAAGVLDQATGGLDTVGVRVPDQQVALALLREFGGGIAAPSANRYGRVSPTSADDVRADLGDDVDVVLDDGPCRVGVESTIVDCSSATLRILREGGVTRQHVEAIVGVSVALDTDAREGVRAPGTHESHYAPRARVEVAVADEVASRSVAATARGERVGVITTEGSGSLPDGVIVLGRPSTDEEYARSLYALLRAADDRQLDVVVAVAPAADGIGAAVADRLRRAAAPRPAQDNA
ncbi:MAG TPA: L-threonylcarbamoyladenylate synthase [Acidimicrobiia bacterium]|nr:L-threonylcarbamoyladenylate synthase [Acidimicrobiia bacterium]